MAKIVIVGAGIGGIPMAFEMKELARQDDEVVVIADTPTFHFVPSNPWVGVNWRKPEDIKVPLEPVFKKKKIKLEFNITSWFLKSYKKYKTIIKNSINNI